MSIRLRKSTLTTSSTKPTSSSSDVGVYARTHRDVGDTPVAPVARTRKWLPIGSPSTCCAVGNAKRSLFVSLDSSFLHTSVTGTHFVGSSVLLAAPPPAAPLAALGAISPAQHASAYVSIRQHASAYASIRQHTPAYASIRIRLLVAAALAALQAISAAQHTSAHVSTRQHTSAYTHAF